MIFMMRNHISTKCFTIISWYLRGEVVEYLGHSFRLFVVEFGFSETPQDGHVLLDLSVHAHRICRQQHLAKQITTKGSNNGD